MKIFCCGCEKEVFARLTNGKEVYPHRNDLYSLPFWKCDSCANYVGTHHKTKDRTRPLGNIPTKEIRNARRHIHKILDPLWQGGRYKRGTVYNMIAEKIGKQYHTAEIATIKEAREIYKIVLDIRKETNHRDVA